MTIALNNTDVIEGGASVASVVDYTISGIVGTTITRLASGTLTTTLTTALYTAGAAVGVSSIVLVNTHSAAVNVTLRLDPADGAVPRYLIPETISLGIGYSLHTNGTKCSILDADGQLLCGFPSPLTTIKGGTGLASYTKGDLLYASATNVLGALGIGAANYKLFTNAAGDLPEWAKGISVTTHTRDLTAASGDVTYTGSGFQPGAFVCIASVHGTDTVSIGFSDGTVDANTFNQYGIVWSNPLGGGTPNVCFAYTDTSDWQRAVFKAWDSDGVELTWVKNTAPSGTLYIAFLWLR